MKLCFTVLEYLSYILSHLIYGNFKWVQTNLLRLPASKILRMFVGISIINRRFCRSFLQHCFSYRYKKKNGLLYKVFRLYFFLIQTFSARAALTCSKMNFRLSSRVISFIQLLCHNGT